MPAILTHRDGWLCAAETTTRIMEPIADTLYWPLEQVRQQEWEDDLGKELSSGYRGLEFSLKIGGFWKTWRLPDGWQTQALAVESAPVPRPKVRKTTELRWYYGRWQKLGRKGYVNC